MKALVAFLLSMTLSVPTQGIMRASNKALRFCKFGIRGRGFASKCRGNRQFCFQ